MTATYVNKGQQTAKNNKHKQHARIDTRINSMIQYREN